jgi:hypothetical protein
VKGTSVAAVEAIPIISKMIPTETNRNTIPIPTPQDTPSNTVVAVMEKIAASEKVTKNIKILHFMEFRKENFKFLRLLIKIKYVVAH